MRKTLVLRLRATSECERRPRRCCLFLNPDCHFQPGTVANLLAELQADERVGMVGGLLVNPDGSEQAGGRRAVPTPWRSFVRAFGLHRLAGRWPRLFFDFHLHRQPLPDSSHRRRGDFRRLHVGQAGGDR
jgi:hypothetical protein